MDVYLDNAATSHPKPQAVIDAVLSALTVLNGNPGRSGHSRALSGARRLLEVRDALKALINAPPDGHMIFCFNATDALNMAIKGSLSIGAHVVTTLLEHNSVLRVLKELERRALIEVTLLEPDESGTVTARQFEQALRPNTQLCISTHASNVTGAIQPVADIGAHLAQHGVRYLIDGSQVLGHIPVNVQALHCALYAFPGHKGLMGPQGTGGLYIAPGTTLRTFREGGTGSSSESMLQPDDPPECYESGTVNLPGIAGLGAGAHIVMQSAREHLNRERALTRALFEGLQALGGVTLYTPAEDAARVGVVSFNLEDKTSTAVADGLSQRGIAVRAGLHCAPGTHQWLRTLRRGTVRVSPSWQNTPEDIDYFLESLRALKG